MRDIKALSLAFVSSFAAAECLVKWLWDVSASASVMTRPGRQAVCVCGGSNKFMNPDTNE